jgi:hypothetical protein
MANESDDDDDDMFGGLSNMDFKNVAECTEEEEDSTLNGVGGDHGGLILEALEEPLARIFKYASQVDDEEEEEEENEVSKSSNGLLAHSDVKDEDAEDSANRDLSILVEWVEKNGGFVHPKLCMAPFPDSGVGGCIRGHHGGLKESELLIRVPAKCIIFSDDASIEGLKAVPSSMASMDLKQMV